MKNLQRESCAKWQGEATPRKKFKGSTMLKFAQERFAHEHENLRFSVSKTRNRFYQKKKKKLGTDLSE
jgi:hypothetical protein